MLAGFVGIAAGLFIYFRLPLVPMFNKLVASRFFTGDFRLCTPEMFVLVNRLLGVFVLLLAAFLIFYGFTHDSIDRFFKRAYPRIITVVTICLALLLLPIMLNFQINPDEIEHIHSAWSVTRGAVPYADFFQHHNALLWYLIALLILVFGSWTGVIFISRGIITLMSLGIAAAVYRVARQTGVSREAGMITACLLLSVVPFVDTGIVTRPDVPMVLFGWISIEYLIRFLKSSRSRDLMVCGLCVSMSFLFLQKAAYLCFAYFILFCFWMMTRRVSIGDLFRFTVSFLVPLVPYAVYLLLSGSFHDYILNNFVYNMTRSISGQNGDYSFLILFMHNGPTVVLFIIGAIHLIVNKGSEDVYLRKTILFITLVLLIGPFVTKTTSVRFFFFAMPGACIVIGFFLDSLFRRKALHEKWRLLLLLCIIGIPLLFLVKRGAFRRNRQALERMEYVLEQSLPTDTVYDGNNAFNLFRFDSHYYWYRLESMDVLGHRAVWDRKYAPFDPNALVKSKRPVIISDFMLSIEDADLMALYMPTPYKGLYKRKD